MVQDFSLRCEQILQEAIKWAPGNTGSYFVVSVCWLFDILRFFDTLFILFIYIWIPYLYVIYAMKQESSRKNIPCYWEQFSKLHRFITKHC